MGKLIDLTGKAFGRLRVLERAGSYRSQSNPYSSEPLWKCLCDPEIGGCGAEVIVMGHNLRGGKVRSCGCLRAEKTGARMRREKA